MSAADWEDLKEEICTQLFLGKEKESLNWTLWPGSFG